MASLIYLDTHVAAWPCAGRLDLIPDVSRDRLEIATILISTMVRFELQLLHEIGRVSEPPSVVLQTLEPVRVMVRIATRREQPQPITRTGSLASEIGLRVCDLAFDRVVIRALEQTWTRDPFDRVIAAQASLRESLLLSKDTEIRRHCPHAVWD